MKLGPWIEKETPKAPTIYGLRLQVTWLELRAWVRRVGKTLRRSTPKANEPPRPPDAR